MPTKHALTSRAFLGSVAALLGGVLQLLGYGETVVAETQELINQSGAILTQALQVGGAAVALWGTIRRQKPLHF